MHGLSPEEEIDYWRERARRAEANLKAAEAVCEAADALDITRGDLRAPRLSAGDVEALQHAAHLLDVNTKPCRTQATTRALAVLTRLTRGGQ